MVGVIGACSTSSMGTDDLAAAQVATLPRTQCYSWYEYYSFRPQESSSPTVIYATAGLFKTAAPLDKHGMWAREEEEEELASVVARHPAR